MQDMIAASEDKFRVMGHHNYGLPVLCDPVYHVRHLSHMEQIKSAGRLIEQDDRTF